MIYIVRKRQGANCSEWWREALKAIDSFRGKDAHGDRAVRALIEAAHDNVEAELSAETLDVLLKWGAKLPGWNAHPRSPLWYDEKK